MPLIRGTAVRCGGVLVCATQQPVITQPAAAAGVLRRNGEESDKEGFDKPVSICRLK